MIALSLSLIFTQLTNSIRMHSHMFYVSYNINTYINAYIYKIFLLRFTVLNDPCMRIYACTYIYLIAKCECTTKLDAFLSAEPMAVGFPFSFFVCEHLPRFPLQPSPPFASAAATIPPLTPLSLSLYPPLSLVRRPPAILPE